jgi:hypothetical protein
MEITFSRRDGDTKECLLCGRYEQERDLDW